jgi:hypothetical protein
MMCHKAWNWETGQLVTGGYIHATDYLNYLRSNGQQVPRAPQDDPCAIDGNPLLVLHGLRMKYPDIVNIVAEFEVIGLWRKVQEFRDDLAKQARRAQQQGKKSNMDLRIKYLQNEIDDDQFKKMLHKREKSAMLQEEINKMIAAYVEVMGDAIRVFLGSENATECKERLTSVVNLQNLMRNEYEELMKVFKSTRWNIFAF